MLCGPSDGDVHHWTDSQKTSNAVFSHWAAGHYSFLHSSAVGTDLFETTFKGDPMNAETGRRFRSVVLGPGGKPQHLFLERSTSSA
jgi:Zn-dependent oligopeptidase